eukprot:1825435-Amphidinium_carterae.2
MLEIILGHGTRQSGSQPEGSEQWPPNRLILHFDLHVGQTQHLKPRLWGLFHRCPLEGRAITELPDR